MRGVSIVWYNPKSELHMHVVKTSNTTPFALGLFVVIFDLIKVLAYIHCIQLNSRKIPSKMPPGLKPEFFANAAPACMYG